MINVLQLIAPVGFYGAERWILALARNLDPDKVNCQLVVTSENPAQSFGILDSYPNSSTNTHRIEMSSRFDLSVVSMLSELIKKESIDVIHTHGYKSDIVGLIAARRCGIKCVSTPHGFGQSISLKLRAYIKLGLYALRWFDSVAPLSGELKTELLKSGLSEAKLHVIENGTDLTELNELQPTQNNTPKPTGLRIGYVGQLIKRKQVHDIIDSFDQLWEQDGSLSLHIAGDGEDKARLESYANGKKSFKNIFFYGFVEDRLQLMNSLDLFVMSSSYEGIPRCMMEAMALKTPVAAYDIPGVDQLVTHGKTGLLAPLNNADALKKCCQELLENRSYAQTLARAGNKLVNDRFSASRMATEYTALYSSLLTEK